MLNINSSGVINRLCSILFIQRKSYDKWFLIGLVCLLVTRFAAIFLYSNLGPYADEDNYVSRGIHFWQMWLSDSAEQKSLHFEQFYYYGYWPPAFSIIIYPAYLIDGYSGVRVFLVLVDIISALLIYKTIKNIATNKAANIGLILYALNPFILVSAYSILSEGLFNFFALLFIHSYIKIFDSKNISSRELLVHSFVLGLLMAFCILTRSAFVLVFIMVFLVTIVFHHKEKRKLLAFLGAGIIMFIATIPWNMAIYKSENKIMFMHTISSQQLYMKFVDRSGGWNSIKEKLSSEATTEGITSDELASTRLNQYFHDIPSIFYPFKISILDFRDNYLMGPSEQEVRMRLGLYNAEGNLAKLNWYVLLAHELSRVPLLFLGIVGLFVPVFKYKSREFLIAVAIGTASVGALGLTSGRHLVNLMPILIIASAVTIAAAKEKADRATWILFLLFLFGSTAFSFNIWQTKESLYWSKSYEPFLINSAKEYTIVNQMQLRRFEGCNDVITLDDPDKLWVINGRSLVTSGETKTINNGDALLVDDFSLIEIKPSRLGNTVTHITFKLNNNSHQISLNSGRNDDIEWFDLKATCIKYKY